MMQAAAAIVRAGGAGVFIDNSGVAHGGALWLDMVADGGSDAVSFAYAAVVAGQQQAFTMGMHAMGSPDLVMDSSDREFAGRTLMDTLRYICGADKEVTEGHILLTTGGPRFQCLRAPADPFPVDGPMHNPFGRLRLVDLQDIAAGN